ARALPTIKKARSVGGTERATSYIERGAWFALNVIQRFSVEGSSHSQSKHDCDRNGFGRVIVPVVSPLPHERPPGAARFPTSRRRLFEGPLRGRVTGPERSQQFSLKSLGPLTTSSKAGRPGTFDAFQGIRKFRQFSFEQLEQQPAFARLRLRLQERPVKTDVLSRDEVLKRVGH